MLCQQLDLFSEAVVVIDGSKFKAVNSSDRNFTQAKLKRRMEEIEANIGRYLVELDTADRQDGAADGGACSFDVGSRTGGRPLKLISAGNPYGNRSIVVTLLVSARSHRIFS